MNPTTESKIGEIAARHPLATRVFARHGIDFCCGGGIPLGEACAKRGLDAARLLEEIEEVVAGPETDPARWTEAAIPDLVDHILTDFHAPLREELPRLESMARKVVRVHGDRDPERLPALLETFLELREELDGHMDREETDLFPSFVAPDDDARVPVGSFVDEHEDAGRLLAKLRALTDDYGVPEGACNTWRALWHGLEDLERALHLHIHLENNVLFPRVAAAETARV